MEKKMTAAELANGVRDALTNVCLTALVENGYETMKVGTGKYAIPTVDAAGNEGWFVLSFMQKKGSRDGDEYDGYTDAQVYAEKEREKEEKRKKKEEEAAKKQEERERKKREKEAAKAKAEQEEVGE